MNGHAMLVVLGLVLAWPTGAPMAMPAEVAMPAETIDSRESETVTYGEQLTLTSIGDAAKMRAMQPGVPVHWQVGVAVAPTAPGNVQVAVSAQGSAELGLVLEYQTCSVRWDGAVSPVSPVSPVGPVGPDCAGEARSLGAPTTVSLAGRFTPLFEMGAKDLEEWLLVTATIPAPANGTVRLNVRATGQGESLTAGPGPVGALAKTGADPQRPALLGVGAVAVGLAAAGIAHARRRFRRLRSAA